MHLDSDRPCDLILALDVPDKAVAQPVLDAVAGRLRWVKIGLQLFLRHGPALVEEVASQGFTVFLDLKLHDIPNTVASALHSLADLPVGLLTLHAGGGHDMLQRAAEAAAKALPQTRLLGVTVLTSFDAAGLKAVGVADTPAGQVERLAALGLGAGLHGLVCSPLELPALRARFGEGPILVTPGVRPREAAADDQKRVLTPAEARAAGSTGIVVGRPILQATDPGEAVARILRELGG